MFLGGQELGLEIEIGTGILGLGLQSPWQTGKIAPIQPHMYCLHYWMRY